ncbi:MAG TPA: cytochrome c oxidase subunit 3 family protein [Candidatus Polarisedimenticolia bacterium]|nr:cytochrome c oxidase subunit 3 family protein [Candidatus Polarisedimenticolia bacterium]
MGAHGAPPGTQGFPLGHHFDDPAQQTESSTFGMWVFLATEVLFFGGLFTAYAVYRSAYPHAFAEASRHLDVTLGTINTAVLIGSSLTMAMAVHAAQVGRRAGQVGYLLMTLALGSVFLAIKGVEYAHKHHEHLIPGPGFRFEGPEAPHAQIFFALYFMMTGMHALHMVIGLGLLGVLAARARMGRFTAVYNSPIEITGLYWHFVDIVWIFLFPLLYLIGLHA